MLALIQSLFSVTDGNSQVFSPRHGSPDSHSALVSQGLPDDAVASSSPGAFSPKSHAPFLHASPSPHSRSFSQLAPHPLPPVFFLPVVQQGKPGGQSALSLQRAGAGRPGR